MYAENLNWQFSDKENMYSYIDVLEKHSAPNFWKHFDAVLDLEMEDKDVQEALEEISREKQYQEKCLSMLVNSLQLCQDDTNTSMEGKMPVIHQNFYYAGLNFTSPAFPCAMSDMLHAMTFVMAVLCRYIQALSAIANDQKSYRLYGLGKAGDGIIDSTSYRAQQISSLH
ncbi:anaphase-promoting complex subunit 2 [Tanacetum coccineum]